mgnify:CR=1 FL=1
MLKYITALFAAVVFVWPLTANAHRYFCEMTEFVIIDVDGSSKQDTQRFVMNVLPNAVSFKSDGYFKNSRASIDLWRGHEEWSATTTNSLKYTDSIYRFGDGVLNVSVVFQKQITSIRAECKADQ